MSIEAIKMALKFCEDIGDLYGPYSLWERGYSYKDISKIIFDSRRMSIKLRETIEQIEKKKPVGYVTDSGRSAYILSNANLEDDTPLYTSPSHNNTFTIQQVMDLYHQYGTNPLKFFNKLEAIQARGDK